ncbi:LysR family transcriptional regulator [Heyndrickxia ginsengihumi]|uniref:LysR family transcriptional regulator n=1 Tax=Heyndrickxia ginsengihumi TaxID=363870 RepID=UPI0004719356|nr:LysR family transcriptional regulator [Heyndrickxia ginsengihumi]
MDEKDWIMLQCLYEERNITKAAEKLYISQPAMTYRLKQLEKEFGAKIVARGKKGVEFTPQGEYIAKYARNMILQLRNTKEYVRNMDEEVRGILRIGASSNFSRYELPSILHKFVSKYPDVEIQLRTGWSFDIVHLLQKEEVHLGIVRGNYAWQEEKHLLREESLYIVSKNPINDLKELPSLPRINYGTDQTLKTLIDHWWQETYDQSPTITMEVDRIDTCKELILTGMGYAILPGISLKQNDHLHKIELTTKDQKPLTRNTWLIYRERSLELSVVKVFIEFLKKCLTPFVL